MIRLSLLIALGLLGHSFNSLAQTATISVRCGDLVEGTELPGVNILVKGTSVGTITDIEGSFTLSAPGRRRNPRFLLSGLRNLEVPIDNRSTIDVNLSLRHSSLVGDRSDWLRHAEAGRCDRLGGFRSAPSL